jgi:hypothetical protein
MKLSDEIKKEIQKCIDSPYYFATTYMTVKNGKGKTTKYSTVLSEKEFNEQFKNYENNN